MKQEQVLDTCALSLFLGTAALQYVGVSGRGDAAFLYKGSKNISQK